MIQGNTHKAISFELSPDDIITRVIKSYAKMVNGEKVEVPVAYAEIRASDGTVDTRPIHFVNEYDIHLYDANGNPLHKGKAASIKIIRCMDNYYLAWCFVQTIQERIYLSQHIAKHPERSVPLIKVEQHSNIAQNPNQTYLDYVIAVKLNGKRFTYKFGTMVNVGTENEHVLLSEQSIKSAFKVCNIPDVYYTRFMKYSREIIAQMKEFHEQQ